MSNKLRTKLLSLFPLRDYFRARQVRNMKNDYALDANTILMQLIEDGSPALVARLGVTEAQVINCFRDRYHERLFIFWPAKIMSHIFFGKRIRQLKELAGVYPTNVDVISKFVELHEIALKNANVIGVWGKTYTSIEYRFLDKNKSIIDQAATSPWIGPDNSVLGNWSKSLDGKKVLVVSPFAQEFQDQLPKMEEIFKYSRFPQANFQFLKPPLTQGGKNDGKNWEIHLRETQAKMSDIDFDIALISAGSYALPLAMHAKVLGKIGINCGGELQLFFGVIGKRWENNSKVLMFLNENWIRPYESNRPSNWKSIEGGCYW